MCSYMKGQIAPLVETLFVEYDALVVFTPLAFLGVMQAVRAVLVLGSRKVNRLVPLYSATSMPFAVKPRLLLHHVFKLLVLAFGKKHIDHLLVIQGIKITPRSL